MTTTENEIGKHVDGLLSAFFGTFPGYDTVRTALLDGKFDDAVTAFNSTVRGPVDGLVAAVESEFPRTDTTTLKQALGMGDYTTVVRQILTAGKGSSSTGMSNPFANSPLDVAQKMCAARLKYTTAAGTALECEVIEVAAWRKVGGADQTFPEAVPGTAGFWHSTSYGGYDVGIISAHESNQTGIVAVYKVRTLVQQGSAGKATVINSKKVIATDYGFTDPRVVSKNVLDPATPLQVTFPGTAMSVTFQQNQVQRKPGNDNIFLGTYKLTK